MTLFWWGFKKILACVLNELPTFWQALGPMTMSTFVSLFKAIKVFFTAKVSSACYHKDWGGLVRLLQGWGFLRWKHLIFICHKMKNYSHLENSWVLEKCELPFLIFSSLEYSSSLIPELRGLLFLLNPPYLWKCLCASGSHAEFCFCTGC